VKTVLKLTGLINELWIRYRINQIEKHYEAKQKYLEEQIKRLENDQITDAERAEIARRLANLGYPSV